MEPPSWERQLWPDPINGPWELRTSYLPVKGRYELVGLAIELTERGLADPDALTSTMLRTLVPGRMAAEWRNHARGQTERFRRWLEDLNAPAVRAAAGTPPTITVHEGAGLADGNRRRPGRRPEWTTERLAAEIAPVYNAAWRRGEHPTQAVASHNNISRSLAAKLVARCRRPDIGLLPPTNTGRARGASQ